MLLLQKPQCQKHRMVAIINHRQIHTNNYPYLRTCYPPKMLLLLLGMKTYLMNELGGNNSKICRQVGRISATPATLWSIYALLFIHCSILLCHNQLWPNFSLDIICASSYLSSTRRFSGVVRLLLTMVISPSSQTLTTYAFHRISPLYMLFTISGAFCSSTASLPPYYSYNPNKFYLRQSWVTLQ